jgi:hypothetical protein
MKCRRFLDLGWGCSYRSVEIKIRDVVPQIRHVLLAPLVRRARRARGTHVRRKLPEDITECHFKLNHLFVALRSGDGRQVLVRPCVAGDLVAFGVHARDYGGPGGVDGAFGDVVAGHD